MTKAKYYVELRGWTSDKNHALKWRASYEADSKTDAFRRARLDGRAICDTRPDSASASACSRWFPHKQGEPIHKAGVRIRHKGRTIARWQDGRMVTK